VEKATAYFQKELGLNVVTIDGARIEFADGWGLLRASNTSPKLVVRVEADTAKKMKEILDAHREEGEGTEQLGAGNQIGNTGIPERVAGGTSL
jgi:phosphomannomutase